MKEANDARCVYVLVRNDLPRANQIVQAGHAVWDAAAQWAAPGERCTMVVLSVPSVIHLRQTVDQLQQRGVRVHLFHESDFPKGDTAACTEPLDAGQRYLLRKFPLWK